MSSIVRLYSEKPGEISKFIKFFFDTNASIINSDLSNNLVWEQHYDNPIEITDIIGTFIENNNNFNINMWINLDENIYINVTEDNADELIRYIFERFPY